MSRRRRFLLVLGVLVVAALLAFPLRETVYETLVIPVAYVVFQLGLYYRSISQAIWWWLLITVVLFMLTFSLLPYLKPRRKSDVRVKPRLGQVQELALWLHRLEGGTYYKWLVANRLGKLSYQILLHRENGRPRSVFSPLSGADWNPSQELRTYLEIGLHGSFADFPHSGSRFATLPKTPLDFEVRDAVEFLESQLESNR
jgi:hypothetical protein